MVLKSTDLNIIFADSHNGVELRRPL